MNPFGNNKPNLSAGDRIKDKKSKYIYAAAKKKFQSGKRCGTKNIKYYKKGTVRSVSSYKIQQNLARGNVLCEDCDDKGMLCSTTISRKNLEKVRLDNNAASEFWGGSTLEPWLGPDIQINPEQAPGFNVIQSDISGVWDPSANDYKGNMCLTPTDCSYGYIDNLINIPRNLNGSGIIIDPSANLFPVGNCGVFRYMKKVQEKIIVKVTTNMDIYLKYSGAPEQRVEISTCDNSIVDINLFKGTYVLCRGQIGLANVQTIFIGVITDICCVCNTPSFNIELFYLNKDYGIPQFGIPYINNTSNSNILPPPWYEITVEFWGIRNSATDYLSARAAVSGPPNNRRGIQSFKVIQGEPCSSYSLSYNNRTKQNYMYCLEDKTKKINFTNSNVYMCEKPATFRLFCLSPGDCTGGDSITDITVSGAAGPRTYRVHVFDSSGAFTINSWPYTIDTLSSFPFDVFSVGSGAGGGGGNTGGGGAGAGGDFSLTVVAASEIQFASVPAAPNPPWQVNVRVGVGGTGGLGNAGFSGFGKTGTATFMTSIFSTIAQAGNGGAAGSPGDNGIGGGTFSGNLGGSGSTDAGGGGGGAGGSGLDAAGTIGGNGGVGITNIITGTSLAYAGGGGGGTNDVSGNKGIGGAGGGGDGGSSSSSSGIDGSLPGAGGGGGGVVGGVGGGGGNGANGRLVIRYLLCT